MSKPREAASDDDEYVSGQEVESDFSDSDSEIGEIRSRGSDEEEEGESSKQVKDHEDKETSYAGTDVDNEDGNGSEDSEESDEPAEGEVKHENDDEEAADGDKPPPKRQLEPYEVPTSGAFYMHDNRFMGDEEDQPRRDVKSKKLWDPTEDKWLHDKFELLQLDDDGPPAERRTYDRTGGRRGRGRTGGRGGRGRGRGGRAGQDDEDFPRIQRSRRNNDEDAPPGFDNVRPDPLATASASVSDSGQDKPRILVVPRKKSGRGRSATGRSVERGESANGVGNGAGPERGRGRSAGRSSRGAARTGERGQPGRSWKPKTEGSSLSGTRKAQQNENKRASQYNGDKGDGDKSQTKTTLNADAKDYKPSAPNTSTAPANQPISTTTSTSQVFQPAVFPGYAPTTEFHNWIPMTVPYTAPGMPPPVGYIPPLGQPGVPFAAPVQPGMPVIPGATAYPRPAIRPPAKRPIPIQPPPEKAEAGTSNSTSTAQPESSTTEQTDNSTTKPKQTKSAGRRYSAVAGNLAT